MSAASAAMRASDRRRSSRATRHATRLMMSASEVDASVRITNIMSPQRELDRDFNDHVGGRSQALGGEEFPLPNGLERPLVQAPAESLKNLDVADCAVTTHDDLEHDLAGNAAPPRVLGVVRFDLADQLRRLDAA